MIAAVQYSPGVIAAGVSFRAF